MLLKYFINNEIKKYFADSKDVKKKEYQGDETFSIYYQEEMANIDNFEKFYLPMIKNVKEIDKILPNIVTKINLGALKETMEQIRNQIFNGFIIIVKNKTVYAVALPSPKERGITDSMSEPNNIFGSRDGFIESLNTNIQLIRTRIKSEKFKIDEYVLGERSQTRINILSMTDITNTHLLNKIKKIVQKIEAESILTLSDLTTYFNNKRIFPTTSYVGSPEMAAEAIYKGQVVIMIDRIPNALILPTSLFFITKLRLDMQAPSYYSTFLRFYVLVALFISVFWLGIMASFYTFHSTNLSLLMIATLQVTQRGVIFSAFNEILILLLLFELYQLVGLRSPGFTVQSIVIVVGGILMGQATVASGLVGIVVMVVTAFSFLAAFTVTSDINFLITISFLRLIMLFASLLFGVFGLSIATIILFSYVCRHKFLNVSFLHPFVPFNRPDFVQFFQTKSSRQQGNRPDVLEPLDGKRKNKS
ncbi:MAG: spore germination protein [Erysipelotrichales bacterium]|nr:spore germination protein [Erysipelotrichales bacterium]